MPRMTSCPSELSRAFARMALADMNRIQGEIDCVARVVRQARTVAGIDPNGGNVMESLTVASVGINSAVADLSLALEVQVSELADPADVDDESAG